MRELHKWKEKIEFSLDNRQVIFLFFGLGVIGAFIFALGMLTGRQMEWAPDHRERLAGVVDVDNVEGVGDAGDEAGAGNDDDDENFEFREGLKESAASRLPRTRAPDVAPRDEKLVQAERKAAEKRAKLRAVALDAERVDREKRAKRAEVVTRKAKPRAGTRTFTLMLKSFSRGSDAQKFAQRLKKAGHPVRVEEHDIKGRTWYRVRLGRYATWDDGLEAKAAFEKREQIIAFLVAE